MSRPALNPPWRSGERAGHQARARTVGLLLAALAVAAVIGWTQLGSGPGSATQPLLLLAGKAQAWAALTVAVTVQSLPFLVLGVSVSALIATFVPASLLSRLTPTNPLAAVPVASGVAIALPGCECSAVPVARSLMRKGVAPAASLAFMLASPSLNPVVIVSTAVAFYATPAMAWARFIASLVAVVAAGLLWTKLGLEPAGIGTQVRRPGDSCARPLVHTHAPARPGSGPADRLHAFAVAALHDLTQAGGFLVVGAAAAALVKVAVPAWWFGYIGAIPFAAVLVMGALAVLLSLCSEADAFVAASFTLVSPTAQLVFLVVGPVVDIKLIAMQAGVFGWRFAARFLPLVALSALASAMLTGLVFFGHL